MCYSLDADVQVVCFGVVDFAEHWDYCFRELVYFHVPLFEQTDAALWFRCCDVEEYAIFLQYLMNVAYCLFYLLVRKAIQRCFLENAVDAEIRPSPRYIDAFPSHASLQISLLISSLIDQCPTKIRPN